jgi:hypothetical protein
MNQKYAIDLAKHIVNSGGEFAGAYGSWSCKSWNLIGVAVYIKWQLWNEKAEREGKELPYLKTKFTPSGLIYLLKTGVDDKARTLASGTWPVEWSIGSHEEDRANYLTAIDTILQIVEDPSNNPYFDEFTPGETDWQTEKPTKVPLNQLMSKHSDAPLLEPGWDRDEPELKSSSVTKPDWRALANDQAIVKAFPLKPSADDLLDLYELAKKRHSNLLLNLAKERASTIESKAKNAVKMALENARDLFPQHGEQVSDSEIELLFPGALRSFAKYLNTEIAAARGCLDLFWGDYLTGMKSSFENEFLDGTEGYGFIFEFRVTDSSTFKILAIDEEVPEVFTCQGWKWSGPSQPATE